MATLRNRVGAMIAKAFPALTRPVHASLWGWVRESFAGAWQNGVIVDPLGTIASFGAVYACTTRIATDIAKLEPRPVQLTADGIWLPAAPESPFWIPLRRPNPHQNRIQFFMAWIVSKLMYGNTYVLKARDGRDMVAAMYILDPRRVTPMVAPNGDVFYSLGGDDLARIPAGMVLPALEIIHDRAAALWHPLVGISPLYGCGLSATQGMRIQRNSAKFFENMSRPSGMLTSPNTIDDPTAARLKKEWEENYSAQNIGRLAVGGDGLKYEPMTIPAETAQLIEQLAWTVEDVARCFRVPLYKINAGQMPTAGNVEALESQYYSGCLQELIESIELCLKEGMKLPNDMAVEFDLEGLLRMDAAGQMDMLVKGVGGAILAPDEARAKRNLPPVPGGNSVYLQQQNYSLAALAKRDTSEDPFGKAKTAASPPLAPAAPAVDDAAKQVIDAAVRVASALEQTLAAQRDTQDVQETRLLSMVADVSAAAAQRDERAAKQIADLVDATLKIATRAAEAPTAEDLSDEDLDTIEKALEPELLDG